MFWSRTLFPSVKEEGMEPEQSLSDKLKTFKSSRFDPDAYLTSKCQSMNEKVKSPVLLQFTLFSSNFRSLRQCNHGFLMFMEMIIAGDKASVFLPCGSKEGLCGGNAEKCLCELRSLHTVPRKSVTKSQIVLRIL